MNIDLILNTDS